MSVPIPPSSRSAAVIGGRYCHLGVDVSSAGELDRRPPAVAERRMVTFGADRPDDQVGSSCRRPSETGSSGSAARSLWRRGVGLAWVSAKSNAATVNVLGAPRLCVDLEEHFAGSARIAVGRKTGIIGASPSVMEPAFDDVPGGDVRCRLRILLRRRGPVFRGVRRSCRDDQGWPCPPHVAVVASQGVVAWNLEPPFWECGSHRCWPATHRYLRYAPQCPSARSRQSQRSLVRSRRPMYRRSRPTSPHFHQWKPSFSDVLIDAALSAWMTTIERSGLVEPRSALPASLA